MIQLHPFVAHIWAIFEIQPRLSIFKQLDAILQVPKCHGVRGDWGLLNCAAAWLQCLFLWVSNTSPSSQEPSEEAVLTCFDTSWHCNFHQFSKNHTTTLLIWSYKSMKHEQALGLAIFDTQLWPDISSLPWHGSARRCPGGDGRSHGGHAAAARDDDVAVRRPGGGVASGHVGRDPAERGFWSKTYELWSILMVNNP